MEKNSQQIIILAIHYKTLHYGKKWIYFEIFSKTLIKTLRKSQDSVLKIGVDAVKIDSFPTVHWYKNTRVV